MIGWIGGGRAFHCQALIESDMFILFAYVFTHSQRARTHAHTHTHLYFKHDWVLEPWKNWLCPQSMRARRTHTRDFACSYFRQKRLYKYPLELWSNFPLALSDVDVKGAGRELFTRASPGAALERWALFGATHFVDLEFLSGLLLSNLVGSRFLQLALQHTLFTLEQRNAQEFSLKEVSVDIIFLQRKKAPERALRES